MQFGESAAPSATPPFSRARFWIFLFTPILMMMIAMFIAGAGEVAAGTRAEIWCPHDYDWLVSSSPEVTQGDMVASALEKAANLDDVAGAIEGGAATSARSRRRCSTVFLPVLPEGGPGGPRRHLHRRQPAADVRGRELLFVSDGYGAHCFNSTGAADRSSNTTDGSGGECALPVMSAVSLFYRRHDDALNHDDAKTAFAALTDGVDVLRAHQSHSMPAIKAALTAAADASAPISSNISEGIELLRDALEQTADAIPLLADAAANLTHHAAAAAAWRGCAGRRHPRRQGRAPRGRGGRDAAVAAGAAVAPPAPPHAPGAAPPLAPGVEELTALLVDGIDMLHDSSSR